MEKLRDLLSIQLQRDVIDETGLTGKCDFRLEYVNDGMMGPPVPMPPRPIMMKSDDDRCTRPKHRRGTPESGWIEAGAWKAPREVMVIDKAEKVPIEN
jgi:uncharacterized protein (TIGR03435 family)